MAFNSDIRAARRNIGDRPTVEPDMAIHNKMPKAGESRFMPKMICVEFRYAPP
jgi:hypothetical protein